MNHDRLSDPVVAPVIALGDAAAPDAALRLPLPPDSPWRALTQGAPAPAADALEELEAAADAAERAGAPWRGAVLAGCPSAALLPLLWLRTSVIGPDAHVTLRWERVDNPGDDAARLSSAALAVSLTDDVRCADAARARTLWGIDAGARPDGAPRAGDTEQSASIDRPAAALRLHAVLERFAAMLDLWQLRTAQGSPGGGGDEAVWQRRTRDALEECARRGLTPVALYGAGTHTRALGPVLRDPPARVICIIDDSPASHGRSMWGFPIVPRAGVLALGVRAVVLSANAHEPKLWETSADLRAAGVEVIRLYT